MVCCSNQQSTPLLLLWNFFTLHGIHFPTSPLSFPLISLLHKQRIAKCHSTTRSALGLKWKGNHHNEARYWPNGHSHSNKLHSDMRDLKRVPYRHYVRTFVNRSVYQMMFINFGHVYNNNYVLKNQIELKTNITLVRVESDSNPLNKVLDSSFVNEKNGWKGRIH